MTASHHRAYLERVIELDYQKPLDELIALLLVACGPLPPPKPFTKVSLWKSAAMEILSAVLPTATCAKAMNYRNIVVLMAIAALRRRGLHHDQLVAYYDHVKARRAEAHGRPRK